jgi:ferredoxin-type protein NapH
VLIPLIGTLLLGKVYCSWICPGYLLFEISGKLRALLALAEIRPGALRFSMLNKYLLLGAGLLVAASVGAPFFSLVYPPAVLSRASHSLVFGLSVSGSFTLLGGLLLIELLISPRWWCRTMCPGGALYGLVGWARPLRVALKPGRCDGCGKCGPVCEMGLDPVRESRGIECDNCGRCLSVCPQRALGWTIAAPRLPRARTNGTGEQA